MYALVDIAVERQSRGLIAAESEQSTSTPFFLNKMEIIINM